MGKGFAGGGKRRKGHVARRLAQREPKLVETSKKVLLVRGRKSGAFGLEFLRDIKRLKNADEAVLFSRKNDDVSPFENETKMEFLCEKNDCGIFAFSSHNKKRPNNIVLGRLYDGHLLDMVEVGLTNFVSIQEMIKRHKLAKAVGSQTVVLFQGDEFDKNSEMQSLRSILLDLFRAPRKELVDMASIDHAIVCTAGNGRVYIRNYVIVHKHKDNKNGSTDKILGKKIPNLGLVDMGPSVDMKLRRSRLASPELLKIALKQPKTAKPKKVKNISHDELQGKMGRIHMKRQDMDKLVTRSRFKKALKRNVNN